MKRISEEELDQALIAITSLISKSEKAKTNLTKGHLTLIENRIKALQISQTLIEEALGK